MPYRHDWRVKRPRVPRQQLALVMAAFGFWPLERLRVRGRAYVQEPASHADPRTTMRYDRGRQSLDRHADYIVATFVASAS